MVDDAVQVFYSALPQYLIDELVRIYERATSIIISARVTIMHVKSKAEHLWWIILIHCVKIHIFALRWRDEIKRSSQLRTLLKRVVVNRTWKKFWTQFIDQLPVGLLAQLVERCTGIAEVMGSNPVRAWIFFRSYLQLFVSVVFLAARIS